MARRVQSRRSVATWSLRDRPVWSRPATGPTRSASADSRLRWTSSSAGSHTKRSAATSSASAEQPGHELVDLLAGQQPRPAEPAHVRDRTRDVVGRQLAVDLDRAGECLDPRVVGLAEPPAPEPHRASVPSPVPSPERVPPCYGTGWRQCGPGTRHDDHPENAMADVAPDRAVPCASVIRHARPATTGPTVTGAVRIGHCVLPVAVRAGHAEGSRRRGRRRQPVAERPMRSRASPTSMARPPPAAARRPPRRSGRAGSRPAARSRP